ncbi:reverse transcriptase-like protein [Plakobranchus ocellatus]|uniref:Reverse transcriptase-like protein n=1 Tax=Plakobranchus ocellatus TaxID=259542 RepID=A0AAV4BFR3_9GAST|nr:reverse transcriptase-like protein [Plakobranchus ocellatus]
MIFFKDISCLKLFCLFKPMRGLKTWETADIDSYSAKDTKEQAPRALTLLGGVGSTVACESALRSAGTLLSRVRAPLPAHWPDGGPESLRSSCSPISRCWIFNWGANLRSLRTIYVSYVRPVLEYANPVLNLASTKSLENLERVQNAALRLITGGMRSTPIAILQLAANCEPLELRREEHTVLTQEKYLRAGEGSALKQMAENFSNQSRRLKKTSVLSAAQEFSKKFELPQERVPIAIQTWSPDTAPTLPETHCEKGWIGSKDDAPPTALRAIALERIDSFDKSYTLCYTDGSAKDGVHDGGYGILVQWPGRQGPGTGSAEVGTALQLVEELVQVENVRIIFQWLPSHVGIGGNETADSLANQGRNQQQPNNPVTLTQVAHLLRRKTAALWEAASGSSDDRTQKFNEARRAGDYIGVLDRCDAVQLFRVRAGHSLLRSDMFRRKWSATTVCRLCGEESEDCSHVLFSCGELSGIRETDWSDITLQEALLGSKDMVRAARLLRVFISRATR